MNRRLFFAALSAPIVAPFVPKDPIATAISQVGVPFALDTKLVFDEADAFDRIMRSRPTIFMDVAAAAKALSEHTERVSRLMIKTGERLNESGS